MNPRFTREYTSGGWRENFSEDILTFIVRQTALEILLLPISICVRHFIAFILHGKP